MNWKEFLIEFSHRRLRLTPDQHKVFVARLADENYGKTAANIAAQIHVSDTTIKKYMNVVYAAASKEFPEVSAAADTKGKLEVLRTCLKKAHAQSTLEKQSDQNASQVRPDPDFHDMDCVINGLEQYFSKLHQASDQSSISMSTPPSPQPKSEPAHPTFSFEVVTVDEKGNITERQQKEAEYRTEDLGNEVKLELVRIPGGKFLMGQSEAEKQLLIQQHGENNYRVFFAGETPQHGVYIPEFWMGKFPVTQAQYQAVMGKNPSYFSENGANRPVEKVSWHHAAAFCERLSQQTGQTYQLPSEAEWEYACRAGTTTPFYFGETITTDLANYNGDSTYGSGPKGQYREQTTEVGSFPSNGFGLYDMHGNVWEWFLDYRHKNYQNAPTDGSVWIADGNSDFRIIRGGSWSNVPVDCRSAYRFNYRPDESSYIGVGFRVVCRLPKILL